MKRKPSVIAIDNTDAETATLTRIMPQTGEPFTAPFLAIELLTDPVALMDICAIDFAHAGEGTLILTRPARYVWDDGNDARDLAEFAELVRGAGWRPGAGIELGSGWLTWQRDNSPIVHMGILRMMPDNPDNLIQPSDTMTTIVERLTRYGELIGSPYRATPGVSGLGALRTLWDRPRLVNEPGQEPRWVKRSQPRWTWNPETKLNGAGDIIWQRKPTAEERANCSLVYPYDVRAMYLAAAAGARLGWDAPVHTGAEAWDPSISGLFRINVRGQWWADSRAGVPIINPARVNSDGTCWVAAPILAYLSELGAGVPDIIDSWTCAKTSVTLLADWTNGIRDALPDAMTAGDARLRQAVKDTYTMSVGMMAKPGGRVYRQDWAATIIDEARVRFHRKMKDAHVCTGYWPVRVRTDCAYYPVSGHEQGKALGVILGIDPAKPRIGHLKIETDDIMTMDDYITMDTRQRAARKAKRNAK